MGASGYGAVPVGDVDVYRHNVITGNDFTGATSGPFSEVKKEGWDSKPTVTLPPQ